MPDSRLDELLERYGALLRRTIARTCPPEFRSSCDDIEQEARISLWKALQGEREIAFPTSYIYKVAVSATLRAIRRAKARAEEPLEVERGTGDGPVRMVQASPDVSPENMARRQESMRQLEVALAGLSDNRREAVTLHLQGLTTSEIGDLLQWSEAKARNLVHRGLKDLRSSLRALGIEY